MSLPDLLSSSHRSSTATAFHIFKILTAMQTWVTKEGIKDRGLGYFGMAIGASQLWISLYNQWFDGGREVTRSDVECIRRGNKMYEYKDHYSVYQLRPYKNAFIRSCFLVSRMDNEFENSDFETSHTSVLAWSLAAAIFNAAPASRSMSSDQIKLENPWLFRSCHELCFNNRILSIPRHKMKLTTQYSFISHITSAVDRT